SFAGYVGSAFFTYKALQTLDYDPQQEWNRFPTATSLKKSLKAVGYAMLAAASNSLADAAWQSLVRRRQAKMKEMEQLGFFVGMEGNNVTLYGIDREKCTVTFQKSLGALKAFQSPQYEIDPIDKRLFVIDQGKIRAYSFLSE
ncbi:MAG: hypothetical protein NZ933_08445, partial [Bacteroidia bacterium]|nr:hypothetical protein [Bacteroidia bacterium]